LNTAYNDPKERNVVQVNRGDSIEIISLINQARNGDRKAFDKLILFHQLYLQKYIGHKILNQDDVADLCQEVIIKAYLKLKSFRQHSKFRTWLFSIAKRLVIDYQRKEVKTKINHQKYIESIKKDKNKHLRNYIEYSYDIQQQINSCLSCIIKKLTIEEQAAVILSDIYEYSDKEACSIMKKNLAAYKHLLHNTRMKLDIIAHNACVLVRKTGKISELCLHVNAHSKLNIIKSNKNSEENILDKNDNCISFLRRELVELLNSLINS